jgi:hypothetical protein
MTVVASSVYRTFKNVFYSLGLRGVILVFWIDFFYSTENKAMFEKFKFNFSSFCQTRILV